MESGKPKIIDRPLLYYVITSNIVKPVFIPTTYLNFSDDPAFRKLSRCSGRPFWI